MEKATATDWERIQSDFPINDNLIWLNNCGTTPLGTPMRRTLDRWLDASQRRATLAEGFSYPGVKASIYRRLGGLLGAKPEEFALIHNTAEGMNFISHGLSLLPGDEILLLEDEYPSNVYPWEHWREKGVSLRRLAMPDKPEDFPSQFAAALGPRTKVAALSAVHWCTGMPLPLEALGAICAERNITWVVDGSQGVGLVDLDVKACRIHYMAFSAWKWLLGPVGLGVLYVAEDRLEALPPIFKGTESVFPESGYLPYKTQLKPSADRFVVSTGSMADWVHFEASLDYLHGIGMDRVGARIRALASHLSQGLRAAGYRLASDASAGIPTGIVVASKPGVDATAAIAALKAHDIIAAERLGRVRLAPHIYNTEAQLDLAVGILAGL
jgi:cysteine desulfurase / selenocysteine lyase